MINCNSFYKETERLILRSPKDEDAAMLASARSTEFVTRYNLYRECDAEQIRKELGIFDHIVLISKETESIIGCISVRDDDLRYHINSKTLHAWLIEEMAYKGYMAEALNIVISELFCVDQIERISIQIISENQASIKLAKKLGFEQEGYLKRALKNHRDEIYDVVLLSLDRDSFIQNR